jgi:YgiT-type zinc finger domain-containing protein
MTCPICNHGKTVSGFTTLVFLKGTLTIIVKNVPAEICNHCDESFLFENVSKNVLNLTRNEEARGTDVKLLHYAEKCSVA